MRRRAGALLCLCCHDEEPRHPPPAAVETPLSLLEYAGSVQLTPSESTGEALEVHVGHHGTQALGVFVAAPADALRRRYHSKSEQTKAL